MLLILVDSLRADMPWAGYPRDTAPHLTRFRQECVSYARGYSVSSYTAKSVAAVLSGQYPSSLRRNGTFFTRYSDANLMLMEHLRAEVQGYGLATHGHMYLRPGNTGLDQGFMDWQVVAGLDFDNTTDRHITSPALTELAQAQLAKVPAGKPFFAYLHYMDAHDVYRQHPESPVWGKKPRDRYDSEVYFVDLHLGKLLSWCRAQPWWSNTVVIVSADHGEAFGEHHLYRHAFELYEVLVRVPLMIRHPEAVPRELSVARSGIDLAPTIAELMGAPPLPDAAGQSLVPELLGAPPTPRPILCDLPADSNNGERRAFIEGDDKLLVFGNEERYERYDLATDPDEKTDLARRDREGTEALKAKYRALWSRVPRVAPWGGNRLTNGRTANGPRD